MNRLIVNASSSFSRHWERIHPLERQAREIVFRFTATRADRFRLVADAETDLSPWLERLRPLADEEVWFQKSVQ